MEIKRLASLLLLGSMILFGSMALCTRRLSAAGLSSVDVTFIRLFIAAFVLLVVLLIRSPKSLMVRRRDLPFLILFGIFKFLADYTFFHALNATNVGLATVFQNTAPYFVMAVSFFLFKEKVSRRVLMAVMVGSFGCVLMMQSAILNSALDPLGLIFAILSGFFLGMYYIGSRISIDREYAPSTYLFYMFLVAMIVSIPFANLNRIVESMSDTDVLINSLILGIVMTLIPYYISTWSVKYLGEMNVSVISVSEVVFAEIVGAMFFDEAIGPIEVIGTLLIIASLVLINLAPDIEQRIGKTPKVLKHVLLESYWNNRDGSDRNP